MANMLIRIEKNPVKIAYINELMIDDYLKRVGELRKQNEKIAFEFTLKQLYQFSELCAGITKIEDIPD